MGARSVPDPCRINASAFRHEQGSNAQPLPAFGAARPNDRTTAARFHAYQKAMGTFTTGHRRLECTFHEVRLASYRKKSLDYSGPRQTRQVVLANPTQEAVDNYAVCAAVYPLRRYNWTLSLYPRPQE